MGTTATAGNAAYVDGALVSKSLVRAAFADADGRLGTLEATSIAEATARSNADVAEGGWRLAGDASLTTAILAETARATAAEALEIANRSTAIAAETTRALAAESTFPTISRQTHRPGESVIGFTQSLAGGDPALLPALPLGLITFGDSGFVARVTGAGIIAERSLRAVEPGQLYKPQFVVQRRVDTFDPAGDAAVNSVAWYDQAKTFIGSTALQTITNLTVASGRTRDSGMINFARAAGGSVNFVSPAGAVYSRAFVQFYGTTCQTDVEVCTSTDITNQTIAAPVDLVALTARVAAIEGATPVARIIALEASNTAPNEKRFSTVGDAIATNVIASVQAIETLGDAAVGDGGKFFTRSATAATGSFTQPDGTIWVPKGLAYNRAIGDVSKFLRGTSYTHDQAVAAALAEVTSGGNIYFNGKIPWVLNSPLIVPSAINVIGEGRQNTIITVNGTGSAVRGPMTLLGVNNPRSFQGGVRDLTIAKGTGATAGAIGLDLAQWTDGTFRDIYITGFESCLVSRGGALYNNCDNIRSNPIATGTAFAFLSGTREFHGSHLTGNGGAISFLFQADSTDQSQNIKLYSSAAEGSANGQIGFKIVSFDAAHIAYGIHILGYRVDMAGNNCIGVQTDALSQAIVLSDNVIQFEGTGSQHLSIGNPNYVRILSAYEADILARVKQMQLFDPSGSARALMYADSSSLYARGQTDTTWKDFQSGNFTAHGVLNGTTGLRIGPSNNLLAQILIAQQLITGWPSIAAGGEASIDITLPGVVINNGAVTINPPRSVGYDVAPRLFSTSALAVASNTVRVYCKNNSAAAATPTDGYWVIKMDCIA